MRTLRYSAAGNRSGNRSGNLLHIETDGCVVNIHVGLADASGRLVTRVDVLPDARSRGGDGQGRFWDIHEDDGNGVTRVVHDPLAEERQRLVERFCEYGVEDVIRDGCIVLGLRCRRNSRCYHEATTSTRGAAGMMPVCRQHKDA